ncbi:sugar transporter [Colletotrichum sojae]|uniref:Sugar transporter n=1 Tax=Colletotrichum sojae TaxID=2175907 RepID=A0A8H6IWD9_9PEZI|nr:sugar transporter [Colletotrichum sojae]
MVLKYLRDHNVQVTKHVTSNLIGAMFVLLFSVFTFGFDTAVLATVQAMNHYEKQFGEQNPQTGKFFISAPRLAYLNSFPLITYGIGISHRVPRQRILADDEGLESAARLLRRCIPKALNIMDPFAATMIKRGLIVGACVFVVVFVERIGRRRMCLVVGSMMLGSLMIMGGLGTMKRRDGVQDKVLLAMTIVFPVFHMIGFG